MRKKILFIVGTMDSGGVTKSIVSLLNVIDRQKYDVSLMIVNPQGPMLNLLPADITVITNPIWEGITSGFTGIKYFIRHGDIFIASACLIRMAISAFSKSCGGKLIAKLMPPIDEMYDLIIDYGGQQQLYYMVDKLRGKRKISFFHNDYKKWPYYFSIDKKYFPKVHSIWTISEQCAQSLMEMFPSERNKVFIMENISSPKLINDLANQKISATEFDVSIPSILSIGHLCDRKGTHWALQAARIMKSRNVNGGNWHWYFLGFNKEPQKYDRMLDELNIRDKVTFLGIRTNPYPYIKHATIISHQSKFEGKSIALDEAKILCKPIVVTNFSTVNDQFINGENATICEMNPESISYAIEELLTNESLQNYYKANLANSIIDNSGEIEKIYRLIP